ncbi:MAG TPA: lysylphosphatidylglycerol synthase transmembrane domain-containing protein [Gemmatimonadaceae bacterium]|nr:lysylphosphatidylglycerol synthase transmembrane domain-containing protein [Gemmatimonadaceae bacterium]
MTRSRWLIVAASFAAMIAISVWIVRGAMTKHDVIPSIPLWAHALALGFVLLEAASRSIKIQWGAHALHIPLSYGAAVRTSVGGDFASCLTPSRSGAEPARFLVLAETGMPTPSILMVLFLELVMEAVTFAVVGFAFWIILHGTTAMFGFLTTITVGYIAFLFGLGALGLLLAQRGRSGPPPKWVRSVGLHAGHWRAIQRSIRHLRTSFAAIRSANMRKLSMSFAASLVHLTAKLAVLPAIVWSIDRTARLSGLVMWPLVLMYGASIAPAPGGGGAIEFGFMKAFDGVLDPPVLATALIWWRFYTLYLYIMLGALAGGATVLRAVRSDKRVKAA